MDLHSLHSQGWDYASWSTSQMVILMEDGGRGKGRAGGPEYNGQRGSKRPKEGSVLRNINPQLIPAP